MTDNKENIAAATLAEEKQENISDTIPNEDMLIPYHHSQRLYDEALECKRTFLLLNEVDHNLYFDNKWHKKVIDWIYED